MIRLAGGDASSGRVEIFYNNQWGTVCDDEWDYSDAVVVCRELGFHGEVTALSNAAFGQGSGQIWLDNVACTGNEESLSYCGHNGWGIENCGHSEDAGVRCGETIAGRLSSSIDVFN